MAQVTRYRLERRGLDESLEAYASRIGVSVDAARHVWRAEGVRLLRVADDASHALALTTRGLWGARIAPGVSVPTRAVTWSEDVP